VSFENYNQTLPLFPENIFYSFPIIFLSYIFLNRVMKTLAVAVVMIAAIAALAIAPLATPNADATHREGHEHSKSETTTTCIHNGNLDECKKSPPPGNSGQEFTQTCSGHGRFITCETTSD
jgi:hypothetical protein